MFRLSPKLLAGIAHGVMAGLIPDPRAKMVEMRTKAGDRTTSKHKVNCQPNHGRRLRTLEYGHYKDAVRATHTGGAHAKDKRHDKYLNSYARAMRAYVREKRAMV